MLIVLSIIHQLIVLVQMYNKRKRRKKEIKRKNDSNRAKNCLTMKEEIDLVLMMRKGKLKELLKSRSSISSKV